MKKHTLSLISVAAAALFATGAYAESANSNLPFEFHNFMSSKTPVDTMVSKEQYMKEMENRWDMAHKKMGPSARKGWVSHRALMDAMKETPIAKGGSQ
jgi:hypothetical protein